LSQPERLLPFWAGSEHCKLPTANCFEIRIERIERMRKRIVSVPVYGPARLESGIFLVGN
jgi:hypothetical protein